jgi:hypothetical protein
VTSATTATTLVETDGAKDRGIAGQANAGDAVVVAPKEPTTLPDDEVSRGRMRGTG